MFVLEHTCMVYNSLARDLVKSYQESCHDRVTNDIDTPVRNPGRIAATVILQLRGNQWIRRTMMHIIIWSRPRL